MEATEVKWSLKVSFWTSIRMGKKANKAASLSGASNIGRRTDAKLQVRQKAMGQTGYKQWPEKSGQA